MCKMSILPLSDRLSSPSPLAPALVEPSFPEGFVLSFPMRTNYMYGLVRKEITEMYAFTACLWLKAKEGGIGTPFSYSVPGQTNELVLLQGVRSPVELLINDKVEGLISPFILPFTRFTATTRHILRENVGFLIIISGFRPYEKQHSCPALKKNPPIVVSSCCDSQIQMSDGNMFISVTSRLHRAALHKCHREPIDKP